jgi:hypothetical protein
MAWHAALTCSRGSGSSRVTVAYGPVIVAVPVTGSARSAGSRSTTVSIGALIVTGTSTSTSWMPQANPLRATRCSARRSSSRSCALLPTSTAICHGSDRPPVVAASARSDGWPSTSTRVCTRRMWSDSSSSSSSSRPGSCTVSSPVRVSG